MQPNQPISSLGGEPSTWPSRAAQYHPFGVHFEAGSLISRTMSVWSADLGRLIAVNGLPYLLMVVLGIVAGIAGWTLSSGGDDDAMLVPLIAGGVGYCIVCALLYVAGQVGSFIVVEESVRGEPRSIGVVAAIAAGLSSMPAMIGIYAVVLVVCASISLPLVATISIAAATESWGVGGAAVLLAFPTIVAIGYASLRLFAVAPAAAVIEELGPIASMRRSLELTRGNTVDLFVAALVFGAVIFGLNMVVGILGLIPLFGLLVQLAAMVVFGSLQSVWMFLAYAGLRDRLGR